MPITMKTTFLLAAALFAALLTGCPDKDAAKPDNNPAAAAPSGAKPAAAPAAPAASAKSGGW